MLTPMNHIYKFQVIVFSASSVRISTTKKFRCSGDAMRLTRQRLLGVILCHVHVDKSHHVLTS
jgi:hypothetical protein